MTIRSLRRSALSNLTTRTSAILAAAAVLACSATGALAQPVQWLSSAGGNDRFYEVVVVQSNISWTAARDAASLRSFGGLFGQLVTPAAASEELFVRTLAATTQGAFTPSGPGFSGPWIGALQLEGSSPGTDNGPWTWISGDAWSFTNWFPGEPNDLNGEEVVHLFTLDGSFAVNTIQWNDLSLGASFYPVRSYVVEYAIPSTSAVSLLALGGLMAARRRR